MSDFVKITAEAPGRSLSMIAPADDAWDALWKLATELPRTDFTYTAAPVSSLDLRAEVPSVVSPAFETQTDAGVAVAPEQPRVADADTQSASWPVELAAATPSLLEERLAAETR